MIAPFKTKKAALVALMLALLGAPLSALIPTAQAYPVFAEPAFAQVWNRNDKPVADLAAARSWTWGPEAFFSTYEPYAEGPGGQHLVSYFDKSRMEINNPNGDRNSKWFVTNGLLVVDMVSGKIQTGDNQAAPAPAPANVPVAGDVSTSVGAPTYASLARVASLRGDNRAADRTGQNIREGLGRPGNVGIVDNLAGLARYAVYEPTLGHNIADAFWTFMNQRGMVYENGRFTNDRIIDWVFTLGYPITEPYWINIQVGNQNKWVLMQAFQRRILTYSPFNPAGWQVEMGNVGRAYYDWRYRQPAAPTPTPMPAAAISLQPTKGSVSTPITVTGAYFPPYAAAVLRIENSNPTYVRSMGTVPVQADGTFSKSIVLPPDAAGLGVVTITATANGGAIRATANYTLEYNPAVSSSQSEIVINGSLPVHGSGFPLRAGYRVGIQFPPRPVQWLANGVTSDTGTFDTKMTISGHTIGAQFYIVAEAAGGYKATSANKITIVAQPKLQITPNTGPANAYVSVHGSQWQPNRAVSLGIRPGDSSTVNWSPNPVITDPAGNFTVGLLVGSQYAQQTQVFIVANDPRSGARLEVPYSITH
jgi:hypothetical protein